MLHNVEGIVLRTQNYGETHKIITVFTKSLGIINAICRGANKGKSRLTAVSQPFIHANFLIYLSKGLSTVQQGEILHSFRTIREDIEKTAYAAFLCEFTNRTIDERKPSKIMFEELLQTLMYIDSHDAYAVPIFMYELKLFQFGGYAPILKHCVRCNKEKPLTHFSVREGGVLCASCAGADEYAYFLHEKLVAILATLQQVRLEQIGDISLKEATVERIRTIFDVYYDTYGGYTLKSKRFLKQMDQFL